MPREELQRLHDIVQACGHIAAFVDGLDLDRFLASDLHRSAVAYQFVVIGEATKSVTEDVRHRHPVVPWRAMAGLRDILAHQYFGSKWQDVWIDATETAPQIQRGVQDVIDAYPDEETS